MRFFSNLIKKAAKFIVSIFRDVEKPVKKTEDTALKAFREFQEFIEKPIEKIEEVTEEKEPFIYEEPEEPEEVEKEYKRKIVKVAAYKSKKKWLLFSYTFENNDIDRFEFLRNKIYDYASFRDIPYIQESTFGYDAEYIAEGKTPIFFYPNSIEGEE